MAALNQTTYRTSKEISLRRGDGKFDLGEQTIVRIDPPLNRPHHTRRARYRVSLANGQAAKAFAQGSTQRILSATDGIAEIAVRALRPGDALGNEFPIDDPPGAAELAANALIQSDDPLVQELARGIAPDRTDPWEVAVALEQHVRRYVSNRNFAQAMASAADVVRSREGDCTEHAVLLAALCRARNIPARVAIGLVYSDGVGGFAYHMWTEAWIADRWVPLDSTLALGGIGAAHLKVSHSDLRGVDPLIHFLPVFQLIGNLRIEVIHSDN
jgi:transglutaminase-like putative cysteine protease